MGNDSVKKTLDLKCSVRISYRFSRRTLSKGNIPLNALLNEGRKRDLCNRDLSVIMTVLAFV